MAQKMFDETCHKRAAMNLRHRFRAIRHDRLQACTEPPAQNDHIAIRKPAHLHAAFPSNAAFSWEAVSAEL